MKRGWCERCGCGNDTIGYAHLPTCPTQTTVWTQADYNDAAEALVNWLQTQNISPQEAGPVLARAMATAIASIADNRESALRGASLIYSMVREFLCVCEFPNRCSDSN